MPTTSERIELVTPLGEELLFHGMLAHEELSRLGEFQLDLLSKNQDVDRDKILGAKVTIKVMLQDDEVRYFNGFVTRFSAGGCAWPLRALLRGREPVAVVPDAHRRLPHLPGQDGPADRRGGVCRSSRTWPTSRSS